ncbi:MAG: hypothetical protein ABFS41_07855, partial [Myxococcota bacterium]
MVRELQHRGVEGSLAREQPGLAGGLDVSREEHAVSGHRGLHHERGVVPLEATPRARRPERLDADVSEHEGALARGALGDRAAVRRGRLPNRREGGVGPAAGRQPDPRHRKRAEHRDETAAMIQVGVARHQEIEATD